MTLRSDHVAGAAFILFGIAVFAISGDLPFGSLSAPGAGMMPKLATGLMLLFGLALILGAAKSQPFAAIDWSDGGHALKVVVIAAAAIASYQTLGFIVTMTLLVFVLLVVIERKPVLYAGIYALAAHRRRLVGVRQGFEGAARNRNTRFLMGVTLDCLWLGFSVALQPGVLWYAFLGCLVGTLVGVLPGIGPLAGISILLPITFGLDATKAIVMLAGIYYGSQYGGSTTSILLRIPGEASSVMTCIDGNAMARKGRAGAALCIAAIGSFIAGTFGVIVLTLIAPPLANIALRFGPPEYTALLMLGLIFLAYMSTSSLTRTLLMACFGLLLGTIGIDPLERPLPFLVRHPGAWRRHRHRAGRGRAVRPWRDSQHPEPQGHRRGHPPEVARAVAESARNGASPAGRSRAGR